MDKLRSQESPKTIENARNNCLTPSSCHQESMVSNGTGFPQEPSSSSIDVIVCRRCGLNGCDVKILDCGCHLHARCTPVVKGKSIEQCPGCNQPCRGIYLLPMSFQEIDEACRTAAQASASGKREKKRKTATIARLNPEVSANKAARVDEQSLDASDLRTGRWTVEEMVYCDKLTEKFGNGQLPVADGIKLNDFLSKMLKSKQSRLTKKMKNAKLSAKCFTKTTGFIADAADARLFSELEDSFFRSVPCSMERAEIRFHLQKEWRELFSSFCMQMGQPLEADDWLLSVEELDRRASRAKDAARMTRRKKMMGIALKQDGINSSKGVFIDTTASSFPFPASHNNIVSSVNSPFAGVPSCAESCDSEDHSEASKRRRIGEDKPIRIQNPPFLSRIVAFMERQSMPFEYVDAWVPSFVNQQQAGPAHSQTNSRLCFAGCASTDVQLSQDGLSSVPISKEDLFHLNAFGEYSQKFSFDIGSGLPGRVYHSGMASWERHVQHAPSNHFERCGGAHQWGIRTVLGLPIPSPNVGRIAVLFYSRYDRVQDPEVVAKLIDEMAKLKPFPRWKLVVDLGMPPELPSPSASQVNNESNKAATTSAGSKENALDEMFGIIQEYMPASATSPLSAYIPAFTALRLLLLKPHKNTKENETVTIMLQSYKSYAAAGRSRADLALLVVRDFLALSQETPSEQQQQQQQLHHPQQQQQQQPAPSPPHIIFQTNPSQQPAGHVVTTNHGARMAPNEHLSTNTMSLAIEPTPVTQLRMMGGFSQPSYLQNPNQAAHQQNMSQRGQQQHNANEGHSLPSR